MLNLDLSRTGSKRLACYLSVASAPVIMSFLRTSEGLIADAQQVLFTMWLLIFPGLGLFVSLRLHRSKLQTPVKPVVVVALGFLLIMIVGLILSRLPISNPLSSGQMSPFLSLAAGGTSAIAFYRKEAHKPLLISLSAGEASVILGSGSLVALGGTLGLALQGPIWPVADSLLFLTEAAIIATLIIRAYRGLDLRIAPLAIGAISLASTLVVSVRNGLLFGADIHLEYYAYLQTAKALRWSDASPIPLVNNMASVTILPTVYHSIAGLDGAWFFMLIAPLALSMAAVLLFVTYRVHFRGTWSLLGILLLMLSSGYSFVLPGAARQEVGILFATLLLFLLTSRRIPISSTTRTLLSLAAVLGVLVSHYSLAYFFLSLFIGVGVVQLLISRASQRRSLPLSITWLLAVTVLSVSYYLLFLTSVATTPLGILREILLGIASQRSFQVSEYTTVASLSPIELISRSVSWLLRVLMLLGLSISFLNSSWRIDAVYRAVTLGAFSVAAVFFVVPGLSLSFTPDRVDLLLRFLGMPFAIQGIVWILSIIRRWRGAHRDSSQIRNRHENPLGGDRHPEEHPASSSRFEKWTCIVAIVLLATQVLLTYGLPQAAFDENKPVFFFPIDQAREFPSSQARYYMTDGEKAAALWLSQHLRGDGLDIYADVFARLRILGYGGKPLTHTITSDGVPQDTLVFVDSSNLDSMTITVYLVDRSLASEPITRALGTGRSLVYDSGDSQLFLPANPG